MKINGISNINGLGRRPGPRAWAEGLCQASGPRGLGRGPWGQGPVPDTLADGFTLAGLGQWADALINSDRVLQFG